jgi:hypothetical protein
VPGVSAVPGMLASMLAMTSMAAMVGVLRVAGVYVVIGQAGALRMRIVGRISALASGQRGMECVVVLIGMGRWLMYMSISHLLPPYSRGQLFLHADTTALKLSAWEQSEQHGLEYCPIGPRCRPPREQFMRT